jgi:hypothetical protein
LGDTGIIAFGGPVIGLIVDDHRPQLVTGKEPRMSANSFLHEEHRPLRIYQDQQGQERQKPAQDENDDDRGDQQVEYPFHLDIKRLPSRPSCLQPSFCSYV